MRPKSVVLLITIFLALIVLVQNTQVVTFSLLFWTTEISQVLLVILVLAIGFVIGFITAKLSGRRKTPKPVA